MAEQLLEGKITIITGGVEDLVNHLNRAETAGEGVADSVSEMASEAQKGSDQFEQVRTELDKVESVMDEMSDRQIVDADGKARLERLRAEMDKFADESDEARLSLDEMQESAGMLKGDLRQSRSQVDKMGASNADARQSAMALGNIMSDLPHGPAAAANNVGNLVEGFGQMNTKGKSMMGIMKAMVGPALIGGLITGVATLAANWDKTLEKIKTAKQFMSGVREEQMKLNKAVRGIKEDALSNLADAATEEQMRRMVEHARQLRTETGRYERRQAARQGSRGAPVPGMMAPNGARRFAPGRAPEKPDVMFNERGQTLLNKTLKSLKGESQAIKMLTARLHLQGGLPPKEALDLAKEMVEGEENAGQNDPGTDFELPDISLGPRFSHNPPAEQDLYDAENHRNEKQRQPSPPDYFQTLHERRMAGIEAAFASAREDILDPETGVRRETRETTGPLVTGVTLNRERRLARSQYSRRVAGLQSRITKTRSERDSLPKGEQRKKLNAKLKKLEAKRRQAKRKHADKMQRIREKEAQKEQRINNARIAGFQKFTGNISSIGNSLNSLYQTWRKQRVAELKKEGKSQKQINKKIKKEGKRRFKMMKKIRIAAAVADTIGASISAFRGTMQSSSFLGPAALPLAISSAAATAAAGYARVRKLQALSIGGGIPGKGGGGAGGGLGSTAKYKRLSGESRSSRVQNFAQEQARDSANDKSVQKTIEDEMGETRKAVREGMAIGDEDAFETQENANDYAKKATS